MKPETMTQIIRLQGGKNWLRVTEPAVLFDLLEKKYLGTADILKPVTNNTHQGWILFVGEITPGIKWVIGYFYERGKWPVCFKGKLKYSSEYWYFFTVANVDLSPKISDFIKKTLEEVNFKS